MWLAVNCILHNDHGNLESSVSVWIYLAHIFSLQSLFLTSLVHKLFVLVHKRLFSCKQNPILSHASVQADVGLKCCKAWSQQTRFFSWRSFYHLLVPSAKVQLCSLSSRHLLSHSNAPSCTYGHHIGPLDHSDTRITAMFCVAFDPQHMSLNALSNASDKCCSQRCVV